VDWRALVAVLTHVCVIVAAHRLLGAFSATAITEGADRAAAEAKSGINISQDLRKAGTICEFIVLGSLRNYENQWK
jgi:hypothetical protein